MSFMSVTIPYVMLFVGKKQITRTRLSSKAIYNNEDVTA